MQFMFCFICAIDAEAIHKCRDVLIQHVHEDIIYQPLESCRFIGQSKRHHLVLVLPVSSPERGVFLRVRVHSDAMEALPDVQLGEYLHMGNSFQDFVNQR